MSNPLPLPEQPAPKRGSSPSSIDHERCPALEQLRRHCSRGGQMLIDRVYAEAQALHKRATDAEEQLELFTGPRVVTDAFPPRDVHGNARPATAPKVQTRNAPEDLL